MARVNEHYLKLTAGYLFPEISRRVKAFIVANPDAPIIKLGIGDVTEPLPPACVEAMQRAVSEMGARETFHGYMDDSQGYEWLREKIVELDYRARDCNVDADEIFVSDGSKCDSGNILDILATGSANTIAVTDPVYPVYVDTNVMAGNTGGANEQGEYDGLVYLRATADNGFLPLPPEQKVDVAYLCYPNNPTGATATREYLQTWVDYARQNGTVILYDAAYEAYISEDDVPHSIYEISGAEDVAIEFRSFSKIAGFTGTRCAFIVVPKTLKGRDAAGNEFSLRDLWSRRQNTKFNGVSYVVQRGAEAVYSDEGRQQVRSLVAFYLENAGLLRDGLQSVGISAYGGVNSPYVWLKTPGGQTSWDFFDQLIEHAHLVGTPGSGFGASGEGYFRLTAFNSRANIEEAVRRLQQLVG
ncbi:MAG: LL-diaminopimelate aminotransferase [Planctomycetes bacterium]|nr:LL-diaminopimelate aminotransferase [Planctomycetota bacterium]